MHIYTSTKNEPLLLLEDGQEIRRPPNRSMAIAIMREILKNSARKSDTVEIWYRYNMGCEATAFAVGGNGVLGFSTMSFMASPPSFSPPAPISATSI